LHGNQSLAVFADIERPSDNIELTNWLGSSSYWIGLMKQWWWWITTDKGDLVLIIFVEYLLYDCTLKAA